MGAALPLACLFAAPVSAQEQSAAADLPGTVWPASAPTVDFGALQALPDWRGLWAPRLGLRAARHAGHHDPAL